MKTDSHFRLSKAAKTQLALLTSLQNNKHEARRFYVDAQAYYDVSIKEMRRVKSSEQK